MHTNINVLPVDVREHIEQLEQAAVAHGVLLEKAHLLCTDLGIDPSLCISERLSLASLKVVSARCAAPVGTVKRIGGADGGFVELKASNSSNLSVGDNLYAHSM